MNSHMGACRTWWRTGGRPRLGEEAGELHGRIFGTSPGPAMCQGRRGSDDSHEAALSG